MLASVRGRTGKTQQPPGPQVNWWTLLRDGVDLLRGRGAPFTSHLASVAAEYGDVATIRDPRHSYLASHPDQVRQLLITDGHITGKARGLKFVRLLLGNGLVTAEGEEHLRNRRLVSPVFNKEHVRGYAAVMLGAIVDHERTWQARLDSGRPTVDMADEMSRLTLRIAGLTLFGTDLDERSGTIGPAVTLAQRMLVFSRIPGAGAILRGPTPWARRLRHGRRRLHQVVDDVIAEHRADPDRFRGDVLSALLAARDDDARAMPDEQIRDEVTTLLLAGHETTSNMLTWTWYLLDRHPEAAALLHAELDALGRAPQPSDVAPDQLPVTRAVIAESMRLYSPAWTVARRYARAGSIGGYRVPPGTDVLASQWVIHRDPRWWGADAARYDPARWLADGRFDSNAPGQPRYAYFPFGAGRRVCVGEHFAWTEAVLIIAALAQRWQPRLDPGQDVDVEPLVTLRPRYGMRMALVPRRTGGADLEAAGRLAPEVGRH